MLQETQVLNQTRCKQARKKTQVFCLIDGFLLESLPIITSKSLVPRQKHEGNKKERVKNISGLLTEESAYRRSFSFLLLPHDREIHSNSASHTHVPGSQQTSWDSSNHTSKQQQKRKAVQILAVEKKERSDPGPMSGKPGKEKGFIVRERSQSPLSSGRRSSFLVQHQQRLFLGHSRTLFGIVQPCLE